MLSHTYSRHKDAVIYNYQQSMVADPEQKKRLEASLMTNKECKNDCESKKRVEMATVQAVQSLCVTEEDGIHNSIRTNGIGRSKNQFTWRQRACVILFYLHPRLGNKNPGMLADVHKVPARTVQNWMSAKSMTPKWLSFARSLTLADVLSSTPISSQEIYINTCRSSLGTPFEMTMKSIKFQNYVNRVEDPCEHTVCNPSDKHAFQGLSKESNYVASNTKKIDCHRHNECQSVKDFISNQVTTAWREGKCLIY